MSSTPAYEPLEVRRPPVGAGNASRGPSHRLDSIRRPLEDPMAYSHDGTDHPTPEQGPSSLRLTLELSDLTTWADLRRFVALGSRLPDETPLDLAYTHQGDLDGLVVYVDNTGGW